MIVYKSELQYSNYYHNKSSNSFGFLNSSSELIETVWIDLLKPIRSLIKGTGPSTILGAYLSNES